MHRIAYLCTAVVLALCGSAASVHAEGFTTITCGHSHFAQVDPILAYSATNPAAPSAHLHDFVGNTSTTASSTTASLLAGDTTCDVKSDLNAIWFPAMIGTDGMPIPGSTSYRLINSPNDDAVSVPPNGLDFIAGNAANTLPDASKIWQCTGTNVPSTWGPKQGGIPASCPAGAVQVQAEFYNGFGCWNGVDMGPGLGRSTGPANAKSHMLQTNDPQLTCPPGSTRIPRVSTILNWPVTAAGGRLSSDQPGASPGSSLHVDFVFIGGKDSLGQDFATRVVDKCLNEPPANKPYPWGICTVGTSGRLFRIQDGLVVLEAGRQAAQVPASAVPLLGYTYAPAHAHYYSTTAVGSPWTPITSPARVEATPCSGSETPLNWLAKYGVYTWTDDAAEQAALVSQGWVVQKTVACTVPAGTPASVPLYRVTMPDGDRVLTGNPSERDQLVAAGGTVKTLGNVYPPT